MTNNIESMSKLYRNFDRDTVMDSDFYYSHVSAMTSEHLHSKSDIAAELACRDVEIKQLKSQLDDALEQFEMARDEIMSLEEELSSKVQDE